MGWKVALEPEFPPGPQWRVFSAVAFPHFVEQLSVGLYDGHPNSIANPKIMKFNLREFMARIGDEA